MVVVAWFFAAVGDSDPAAGFGDLAATYGPFAPFAIFMLYLIREQRKDLREKDAEIKALNEKLANLIDRVATLLRDATVAVQQVAELQARQAPSSEIKSVLEDVRAELRRRRRTS